MTRAVILGAGPAGLSAAYELEKSGVHSLILEKEPFCGGLSRTEEYKGYLFDLGGHRFYTKVPMIEQIWRDVLGSDLIERPRLSRIFYRSKFFSYPLDFRNALSDEFDANLYSRGNNPTINILRKKLAALDGAEDALVFGSGMSCSRFCALTWSIAFTG